ncbi:unnamed protein product [Arctia plantaginis]|uniref:Uncharacterized protein n=1 Tax=Arctia plantaginis TaxID=874455 RepID=A0A8S1B2I6_ARCPL|nr:unnamed protein product [Arctia plantaginis]
MDVRIEELNKLRSYTEEIDKDLTMILQSVQWDRKQILQHPAMVSCKYDVNHKICPDNIERHEQECVLRLHGYSQDDQFLPHPLSSSASTLMKLGKEDILHIIDKAAHSDPTFKKGKVNAQVSLTQGVGSGDLEPQTLGRLQCTYSVDERRAIYDAVVAAAPSCHDLTDLALPSVGDDGQTTKTKTRMEILAELRDMRRRRTKYRVAPKSRNYSDVLRDVIKTQMEMYNEVLGEVDTKPDVNELNANITEEANQEPNEDTHSKADSRGKQAHRREFSKRERDRDSEKSTREKDNTDNKNRDDRYNKDDRGRSDRHQDRCRDKRLENEHNKMRDRDDNRVHRDKSRDRQRDRSRERKYDTRRDRDYKRKERHAYDSKYREHKERDRPNDERKSIDRGKKEQRDSDTERARNLILEIKREIESIEETEDMSYQRDNNENSDRVNQEKHSGGNNCHSNDYHRYSEIDYDRKDRSKNRNSKEKDHKRHKDKRESDMKEHRAKHERHKRSRRDRSYDKDVKRSRTEEKHRTYYAIYAELDSRKHKGNGHEQN